MIISSLLAAAAAPQGGAAAFSFLVPMLLMLGIFWILVWRPQSKRMKAHQESIMAVKKGDRVITGGGLIGKVTKVNDTEVEVELGPNIRVTAVKSTLSQVGNTATKPAND